MNYYGNRLIKAVDEKYPSVFTQTEGLKPSADEVGVWLDKEKVPLYSGPFSRKCYTQHQHLKCLVVKTLFRLRYRGLTEVLGVADALRHRLGLSKVPHYTT